MTCRRDLFKSYPPKQRKNYDNDQYTAENADAAMTVATAVAAEQENHEDDNEDQSELQGYLLWLGPGRTLSRVTAQTSHPANRLKFQDCKKQSSLPRVFA